MNGEIDRETELLAEIALWKRIAERNHKANLIPCPNCGYQPRIIKPMEGQ